MLLGRNFDFLNSYLVLTARYVVVTACYLVVAALYRSLLLVPTFSMNAIKDISKSTNKDLKIFKK